MKKRQLAPNTTLYPVPVVLVTCGQGQQSNLFTLNRIASCNAEPPMIAISVRPGRASHALIAEHGEFAVNIPFPDMELIGDFVGSTTMRNTDKWAVTGLTRQPAVHINPPLLAECPVNLECRVVQQVRLPSHTLFIAEVLLVHADPALLNARNEVDFERVGGGLPYRSAVVRERPVDNFQTQELRAQVQAWRAGRSNHN